MADQPKHMLLFGCGDDAGHFLHQPAERPRTDYAAMKRLPGLISKSIDGGFPPQNHRREFVPQRTFMRIGTDGWTVLAWWDYSVDERGGSNTVLIWQGHHSIAEMLQVGKAAFPWAADRIQQAAGAIFDEQTLEELDL